MKTASFLAALAATLATACTSLPEARMALPAELQALAAEPLQGLGGGRSGSFELAGQRGDFERSASRLELFDAALARDSAAARYRWGAVTAGCKASETTASKGLLAGALRPYGVQCQFSGPWSGELLLEAPRLTPTAQASRSGRISAAGSTLTLRSVHRVQGSPLALDAPIGYVFELDGRAVGAVELNGRPRLWRPAPGTPLHEAVTHGALALALLWDPAAR